MIDRLRTMTTVVIVPLLSAATLLANSHAARADIYRYVNEEGIECFTDAPLRNGATRIMAEKPKPAPVTKRSVPGHLQATGIAEKTDNTTSPPTDSAPATPTVLPVQGRITSPAGLRRDPIDGTLRNHQGVDIAVPTGTPVHPVAPGVVVYSGARGGYGYMIIIEHGDGMLTLYAHNSTNLAGVGTQVTDGTTIALSGSTGRSTGPHLHFEAWKGGENLTDSFVASAAEGRAYAPSHHDNIRTAIQADGSILFTNIP
ncbi:M23 family metallopeptidase [Geobacter sp. AOG1]|uniref:M23 family metallopeptidase n=1 Tax=Geobacter sp. AOG1 TaxID=1566346 RepID=UPI001CC4770A|nr:M23 family metallopeptidase [Geobacter sp. AOG1]GFE58673.1 peptidase M23 [Geobacter sp. AOG1]